LTAPREDGSVSELTRACQESDALGRWVPPKKSTLDMVKEQSRTVEFTELDDLKVKDSRALAQRRLFAIDSIIGAVIVLNTLVLGVSTDVSPLWLGWIIIDGLFAFIFLMELVVKVRIIGLQDFVCGREKVTNFFEMALVVLAILEFFLALVQRGQHHSGSAQLMSLLRTVRLFRVLRVLRVLRLDIFKELKVMIQGMIGGMRTLMWSVMLITLPVYGLCLVLREELGKLGEVGHGASYFDSMPRSFFTVFRCIVIGECADAGGRPIFVLVTERYGWAWGVVYSGMSVFMTFGLFNVIVAMFVENVVEAAKSRDKLARKWRLRDEAFFAQRVTELLHIIFEYTDGGPPVATQGVDIHALAQDMEVTPEIFDKLRQHPRVRGIFDELDIADDDQYNLFETLDADGSGTIDLKELCDGIMKLRGDACRSDIIAINFMLQNLQAEVQGCNQNFLRALQGQADRIGQMHAVLCQDEPGVAGAKGA